MDLHELYGNVTADPQLIKHLEALRKTQATEAQDFFWEALHKLGDLNRFYANLTLMSWGWYFPPESVDPSAVSTKIYLVLSGIVRCGDTCPACPMCGGPTAFENDSNRAFGWRYRCTDSKRSVTEKEKRKHKYGRNRLCRGTVSATKNSWVDNSKCVTDAVFLSFAWLNRLPVSQATASACSSTETAVDYYSMCREVAEVVMSNEIKNHQLGGPGVEVEVDECYLTRRKYNVGRVTKTGTITILGK